jgi:ABC-type lipoprotein release transport system permease subunit
VLAGLATGFVLALAAGRAHSAVIYGTSPRDPGLLLMVFVLLVLAAALSCWGPAACALRTDPMSALRYE